YRAARETLVEELGIEPAAELQEIQRAILRHDPALDLEAPRRRESTLGMRTVLVAALEREAAVALLRLAEPLVKVAGPREIVVAATVGNTDELLTGAHRPV